jgi:hypothetical protein
MSDPRTYFLADDIEKAVPAIDERIDDYYTYVRYQGLLDLWRASNRACYAGFYTGGEIGKVGKQGEFMHSEVNEVGNLHQHLLNLITAERPAFEARIDTMDTEAQQAAPLAVSVIEHVMREKKLGPKARDAADVMLRAGEAYLLKKWDPTAGPTYASRPAVDEQGQPKIGEDGQPIEEPVTGGDVEYAAFHPIDVARDVGRSGEDQRWRAPRRKVNRFDLMARYPDLADKIDGAPSVVEDSSKRPSLVEEAVRKTSTDRCDDVWVTDVLVERGPATPEGRLITYVTTDCVLFDGPLPSDVPMLYRMAAKELEGSAFGYALLWDILAPQLALNAVASQITTMASKLTAVIWEPDGKGLAPQRIQGIITLLKGGTVAPQVLDLLKIPGELFKLVDFYLQSMERLSGVNAVFRGQTAEGQKGLSGAAYALFAARAIEFGSRMQGAYNETLEAVATGTIRDYQRFGAGEYLIQVAGEGNKYRADSFQAEDLQPVSGIALQITNPMQATQAGRFALFESLQSIPGAITTPAQGLQVLTTGRLDSATQATQRELENIARENEKLSKGEPVIAIPADRHWTHIPEHAAVAATPEARENPAISDGVGAHIQDHLLLMRNTDPVMLAIQGCPPELIQMVALTGPPPMNGTPPPVAGATDATLPPEAGPVSESMPAPGAALEQAQPSMPTDPMTNQQMPAPGAV